MINDRFQQIQEINSCPTVIDESVSYVDPAYIK